MASRLKANRQQLDIFVSTVFKHADEGTFVVFRAFDRNDKPFGVKHAFKLNGAGPGPLVDLAFDVADECANADGVVFCPPVSTFIKRTNARTDNLANGLVICAELDERPKAARETLEGIIGKPTFVVRSGGIWTDPETGEKQDKLHLYWLLNKPTRTKVEHLLLYEARRYATALVGGDASAVNSVHPLRWPGSWHTKAKPRPTRIVEHNDVEIELGEAFEKLREAAEAAGIDTERAGSSSGSPVDLQGYPEDVEAVLEIIPNDERNWAFWSLVVGSILNATDGEGDELIHSWSEKCGVYDPGYTDRRIEEIKRSPFTYAGYPTLARLAREVDPGWIEPSLERFIDEVFFEFSKVYCPTIDITAPLRIAKRFRRDFSDELHHHRAVFYRWNGRSYTDLSDNALRSRLYEFLDLCRYRTKEGVFPVKPNQSLVTRVADALRAAAHLNDAISPPAWLTPADHPAHEIVACENGLLHLPSRKLLSHTPNFYTHNALNFAFDPGAPQPQQWLNFLNQLWPDDPASIKTLQEIFGLALTGDTSHQKIFLLVGPKRSGKGTIARVLRRLIGEDNTVAPTLAGLGTNFGLAPLIGKQIAIISDARLSGRADQQAIAERLLSISGEDAIDVDRKYLSTWTGQLKVRFIVLSNELPRLADASGALASRFIVLVLTRSFFDEEDLGLTDRLLTELPGILNWSIGGRERLDKRGYFRQPKSAAQAVQQLEDLGSTISVFLRECCILAAGERVEIADLFKSWCDWCEEQGRDYPGNRQTFGRDLHAAVPGLKESQPRIKGRGRVRMYEGIGLK